MRGLLAGTAFVLLVAVGSSGQPPEAGSVTGTVRLTTRVRGTPLASNAEIADCRFQIEDWNPRHLDLKTNLKS